MTHEEEINDLRYRVGGLLLELERIKNGTLERIQHTNECLRHAVDKGEWVCLGDGCATYRYAELEKIRKAIASYRMPSKGESPRVAGENRPAPVGSRPTPPPAPPTTHGSCSTNLEKLNAAMEILVERVNELNAKTRDHAACEADIVVALALADAMATFMEHAMVNRIAATLRRDSCPEKSMVHQYREAANKVREHFKK